MAGSRVALIAVMVIGCGNDLRPPSDDVVPAISRGAVLYQEMCEVCHGEVGEGGLAPRLQDNKRSHGELSGYIAARMPANNPGQCAGDCATEVATFILDSLTTEALRCDAVPPGPRQLRLLTRREYRATVADLFGDDAPVMACGKPSDCAYRDECSAGTCQPSACDSQMFVFDPGGRALSSVHVAGTFNSWAGTIAAGGLRLTYSATTGLWTGMFAIGEGLHQYKFVLDEHEWVDDPRSPTGVSDGFGGRNASVALSCENDNDPAARVPAEHQPAGFPFDTESTAALVTSTHVEAYLAAAEPLADHVAAHPDQLLACNWAGDAPGCGRKLVEQLGRRIFRRPLTAAEVTSYGTLAATDLAGALEALLVSPSFLYRSELGEKVGDHYRLTAYEVATALSYSLIGTTPSAELLAAAGAGELDTPAGIERWARLLLADRRARDQVGELVLQWIGGQTVLTADKRPDLFPGFDSTVRRALTGETRRFAADVVFDGSGRFEDLLTADYTVLDPTAAAFYGLTASSLGAMRTPYSAGQRSGLLGHASMLAATAHSDQTSPIRRGLLVRRNLLCQALPPPPPFAGGVPDVDPSATTRERFAQHTANEVCAGCHKYIDGIGFGLEHFDPVGRWRDSESGQPIDAHGEITDVEHLGSGTSATFSTVPELASIIANSGAAASCFTRQYLRFSRGLRETIAQRCERLWLEQKFDAAGHDVRELIVQSVLSPAFRERR